MVSTGLNNFVSVYFFFFFCYIHFYDHFYIAGVKSDTWKLRIYKKVLFIRGVAVSRNIV